MGPQPNLTYISVWELLPDGLAIAASAAYLIAVTRTAQEPGPIDSLRVRILACVGLLSCILSGIGTFSQVISTYLIVAEPFELLATVLFGIMIFRPNLMSRSKLRTYSAVCVAISGLYATLFMSNTLLWLAHRVP